MLKIRLFILLVLLSLFIPLSGQISNINVDTTRLFRNTDTLHVVSSKPLLASGIILFTNLGVWSFDRYITTSNYAHISINSISKNIKTGFVWDNDMFATNLFAHPYHGGLYFNAARSNGIGFWKSIPYTACGSLMWEFCMENEPAAINDFMATTIGGTCLGEMTYRLSDLVVDDRSSGFERFGREFLLTLISPSRGLNRIISGDCKRTRSVKGSTLTSMPLIFQLSIGHRIFKDYLNKPNNDVINAPTYDIRLNYGYPFDEDITHPYDAFLVKIEGNFFSSQPIISRVNALAMLYSNYYPINKNTGHFVFGVFQHFNFYESNTDINHISIHPYKISEAASVGPGILYMQKFKQKESRLLCSLHLSGILLGGSQTDHYKYEKRDYNMGSGFSTKLSAEIVLKNKWRFYINSEEYRIYSWVKSNPKNQLDINSNTQGDIGNANLFVTRIGFNYFFQKHFILSTETSYNYRKSQYKYYPEVKHAVVEHKTSIGYTF